MIRLAPAQCRLQRKYRGMAGIGYRVLNLDGTLFSPFTQRGVMEVAEGYYTVLGGIPAPSAGGTIIWGESDHDILPWPIDPAPAVPDNSEQLAGIAQAMTELTQRQPAKPDKTGYGLDRATLATVGEMFEQALARYSATEIHAVAERIMNQFAELALVHGESTRTIADATTSLHQMTERAETFTVRTEESYQALRDGVLMLHRFYEASGKLAGLDAVTERLDTIARQMSEAPQAQHQGVNELRLALTEFVGALATDEPEPQQYTEDEAEAMLEAAARVLARRDE